MPPGVSRAALDTVITGPIVAKGTFRNSANQPARGTVALVVWPGEEASAKIAVGEAVETPTVGWATTSDDGTFQVRVDPKLVPNAYVRSDGMANFEAIAWDSSGWGSTSFAATTDGSSLTEMRAQKVVPAASADLVVSASRALKPSSSGAAAATGVEPLVTTCHWLLRSTFNVWTVIGNSWPYGSDKGWMETTSSHSVTVGTAVSATGTNGSWSVSGTSSATTGVTFEWNESVAYRALEVEHQYGRFQWYCAPGGAENKWQSREITGTGGFTTVGISPFPNWTNCASVSAGLLQRTQSSGNHFSSSAGVKSAAGLGINLSVDTNYDSSHILKYRLVAAGKTCGNNALPAIASQVQTKR